MEDKYVFTYALVFYILIGFIAFIFDLQSWVTCYKRWKCSFGTNFRSKWQPRPDLPPESNCKCNLSKRNLRHYQFPMPTRITCLGFIHYFVHYYSIKISFRHADCILYYLFLNLFRSCCRGHLRLCPAIFAQLHFFG